MMIHTVRLAVEQNSDQNARGLKGRPMVCLI